MAANQSTLDLNWGQPSNFCWLRKAPQVKFTLEGMMSTEKHILARKKVYKYPKKVLREWVERTIHRVEIVWLFDKVNVPGTAVNKEGHADSVQVHERSQNYSSQ